MTERLVTVLTIDYPDAEILVSFPEEWQYIFSFQHTDTSYYVARMPAILSPEDEDHWLNPDETEPARLKSLLKPYPAHLMVATRVSQKVNNPRNDTKEIIEPFAK